MRTAQLEKRKAKGGTFLKITLFSYAIVCTTLILLSFLLNYSFFYRQLETEVRHSQELLLSVFRENVTTQFKNLDEIASLIKNDPDMLPPLADSEYSRYKNCQKLRAYLAINPNLIDIYYYRGETHQLFSAVGNATPDEYVTTYYQYENFITPDLWEYLDRIRQKTLTPLFSIRPYSNRNETMSAALYIVPLSYERKLVFVLKETFFTHSLEKYFRDDVVSLSIFDPYAQEILTIGQRMDLIPDFLSAFDSIHEQTLTRNQRDSFAALISGYYNSWYYYLVYRIPDYAATIQLLNTVTLVLLAAVIAVGVFLSLAASHYNYRPIRNLYRSMLEGGEIPQKKVNELKYIENYLRTMKARSAEMSRKHEYEYTRMLDKLMAFVMNGRVSYQENSDVFQNTRYAIPYQWLCVLAYHTPTEQAMQAAQRIERMAALPCDGAAVIPVHSAEGKLTAVIVNAMEYEHVQALSRSFCEQVIAECGSDITFGVGSRYDSPDRISVSYSRALIALATVPRHSQLHFYSQLGSPHLHLEALNECRQRIVSLIEECSLPQIEAYLKSVFNARNEHGLQMAYYAHIISALLLMADQHELETGNLYEYLAASHFTQEDFLHKTLSLSAQLCQSVEVAAERSQQQLLKDIVDFISVNTANPELTSQMVADHFGISLSYLNRYFKSCMDMSPTAFIDRERLTLAARLVAHTDLQIKEIVLRAGYGDVNNFIRKFKKIYGVTPMQYRNQASTPSA